MPTTAYTFTPPPRADTDAHHPTITNSGGDVDENTGYIKVDITAANPVEAEQHALAHIAFHYEDDLRGAIATATPTGPRANGAPAYTVHIALARPRN